MSSPITLSGFNNIDFSSGPERPDGAGAAFRSPSSTTQQTALNNQKTFFATFASKLAGLESAVDGAHRRQRLRRPQRDRLRPDRRDRPGRRHDAARQLRDRRVQPGAGPGDRHVEHPHRPRHDHRRQRRHADHRRRRRHPDRATSRSTVSPTPSTARRASASAPRSSRTAATSSSSLTGQATGAANTFAITNGLSGGAGVAFSATNAQDASNAEGTVNGIAFSTPTNTIDGRRAAEHDRARQDRGADQPDRRSPSPATAARSRS